VDADGAFSTFRVLQSADADFPTLRRHRLAIGLYDLDEGRLVRRTAVETDVTGEETSVPELVGQAQPDLVLLNDGDLTYAKVRLDERSLRTLVQHVDGCEDSLARALCYGAAWDMTRDAEMSASDWLEFALRALARETDLTAVRSLLSKTTQAVSVFSAPDRRDALRGRWESELRGLALAAAPSSDLQLSLVRGLVGVARSDETLELLAGVLDGSRELFGLAVDTDLRWQLLSGLARQGYAGEAEIEAELDRDNTIAGQEHAAGARASMPTATAKARAWTDAVERDDVPNETMRSIAASFHQTGQDDVLAPYVARYLETGETIWEERGVHQASTVLEYMFPRKLANETTLEAVDSWLSTTKANPAARRLVSEGRDDVARALAAQQRDAQS
jgi:aminopeptidase N